MHSPQDLDRDAWIQLARSVGARTFWKLLSLHSGCPRSVLSGCNSSSGSSKYSIVDLCAEKESVASADACWLLYHDPHYPDTLKELPDAPPLLVAKGNTEVLTRSIVSVVGARNCSTAGATFTRNLCAELGAAEVVIASGFARGIDTAAHKAGLSSGTVAILAGGVDNIYPEENAELYAQIINHGGVIISESRMGSPPLSQSFHSRNRIVAGIGRATIVVEALSKSGSIMTARLAGEYNREVFAVPGHPLDPRSEGVNMLIKNGATMLCDCTDINLEELGFTQHNNNKSQDTTHPKSTHQPAPTANSKLLDAISYTSVTCEELARFLDQDIASVKAQIMSLELDGLVRVSADGRVARA